MHHLSGDELHPVASLTLDPISPDVEVLIVWLEGVLATVDRITPNPREIARRLGASSPSHALDAAELASLYAAYRELPTVSVTRGLWARVSTRVIGVDVHPVADAARFDRLVSELADKAANRTAGSALPSLLSTFRLFAVAPDDQPVLERTFRTMCEISPLRPSPIQVP